MEKENLKADVKDEKREENQINFLDWDWMGVLGVQSKEKFLNLHGSANLAKYSKLTPEINHFG